MKLPIFQVDAFAERVFCGNPAAVVVMPEWLPDATLLGIARENNYSETAFVLPREDAFDLRWFTPEVEMDLCGHATLASGYVVLHHGYTSSDRVIFHSKAGELAVTRKRELLAMDFPARAPRPRPDYDEIVPSVDLSDKQRVELPVAIFIHHQRHRNLALLAE